mgnify:CR=1 FL=1
MQSLLAESNYWFLGNLNYVDALLNLEIAEGIVSSSNKDIKIDDLGTIEDCSPIEITDQSRRVQIKFSNVLAYQVTDESYWASENLRLSANILLYQPSISNFDHQGVQNNVPRVAFETGLVYRPTKNSFLEISFKNLPNYGLNNRLNNNLSGRRIPGSYGLSLY